MIDQHAFGFHGAVSIAVQRKGDAGMTEDLAQCLDLASGFDASGGECVAKRVEMNVLQRTRPHQLIKMVLEYSGLHVLLFSRQHVRFRIITAVRRQLLKQKVRKRNDAVRALAFRRIDDDPCLFAVLCIRAEDPLQCLGYMDAFAVKQDCRTAH